MSAKFRTITQASKKDPSIKKLIKGPNGRNLCRFCKTEVTPPRRTFCSGAPTKYTRRKVNGIWISIVAIQGHGCVHEWLLRSNPRYARNAVYNRDQGVCAVCGTKNSRKGSWHTDHIIPVWKGGGLCSLENLQSLCHSCHKEKTKNEAAERALLRKKI